MADISVSQTGGWGS